MKRVLPGLLVGAAIFLITSAAQATTVTSVALTPAAWAGLTPATSLNIGTGFWAPTAKVRQGSQVNVFRSPFDGSYAPAPSNWESISYYAVGPSNPSNPATLKFNTDQKQFSFLWGSIDTYNTIDFYNNGAPIYSLLYTAISGAVLSVGAAYVTVAGLLFDTVIFRSSQEALEFSHISTLSAVPLPAGLPLLGAGLGLLGYLGWRKKKGAAPAVSQLPA